VDKTTLPGILLAFGCVLISVILEGGDPTHLLSVPALILVVGATISVGMLGSPFPLFMAMPKIVLKAILDKPVNLNEIIDNFVRLADRARKEGLLALEQEAQSLDPFARKGVLMVVDGSDAHLVREVMEAEVDAMQQRHKAGFGLFEAMGAYSPTIGIIGTTTGLVHVLSNLAEPEELGHMIAAAFIATLYGISTANLFFLPIAQKLKGKSAQEVRARELTIEGVLSIQAGDNPRLVRGRLEAFLPPNQRTGDKSRGADEGPSAERAAA
jgi:chemotaxis protein MotA